MTIRPLFLEAIPGVQLTVPRQPSNWLDMPIIKAWDILASIAFWHNLAAASNPNSVWPEPRQPYDYAHAGQDPTPTRRTTAFPGGGSETTVSWL